MELHSVCKIHKNYSLKQNENIVVSALTEFNISIAQ